MDASKLAIYNTSSCRRSSDSDSSSETDISPLLSEGTELLDLVKASTISSSPVPINIGQREVQSTEPKQISDADADKATAFTQANHFLADLSPKLNNLFLKHGLNEQRLMPLFLLHPDDDKKVRETLDQLLREVVACPEPEDLNHHTLHRSVVSSVALGGTGANRWFGLSGLSSLLPVPPFIKKPLAIAVTGMAFVSDNLQGAYGANRTRFEGGGNWTSWLALGLSLLPTAITATMTFRGIIALGFGPWAAGAATFGEIVGSLPFYYTLTNRLSYVLKGQNAEAEERADRGVWLLSQVLKNLGERISNDEENIAERCQSYARVLRLSVRPGCASTFLRQLCLYAPGDKVRNVIRELREHYGMPGESNTVLSLGNLEQDAEDKCTQHPRKNLLFNLGIMSLLSMPSSWGEAASVTNPLIATFGPSGLCRGASQIMHYLGWQLVVNTMMISQTISQSVLVNENLTGALNNIKKLWDSRHALNLDRFSSLFRGTSARSVAKKLGNQGIMLLGVLASLCFTLSYAGAINTSTHEDFCLQESELAAIVLSVIGSIPVLLATLNMGKELKQVFLYFGRTLAQCCTPRQRKQLPWYLQYASTRTCEPVESVIDNDQSGDDERTAFVNSSSTIQERTWRAGMHSKVRVLLNL